MAGVDRFLDRRVPSQAQIPHGDLQDAHAPGGEDHQAHPAVVQDDAVDPFLLASSEHVLADRPAGLDREGKVAGIQVPDPVRTLSRTLARTLRKGSALADVSRTRASSGVRGIQSHLTPGRIVDPTCGPCPFPFPRPLRRAAADGGSGAPPPLLHSGSGAPVVSRQALGLSVHPGGRRSGDGGRRSGCPSSGSRLLDREWRKRVLSRPCQAATVHPCWLSCWPAPRDSSWASSPSSRRSFPTGWCRTGPSTRCRGPGLRIWSAATTWTWSTSPPRIWWRDRSEWPSPSTTPARPSCSASPRRGICCPSTSIRHSPSPCGRTSRASARTICASSRRAPPRQQSAVQHRNPQQRHHRPGGSVHPQRPLGLAHRRPHLLGAGALRRHLEPHRLHAAGGRQPLPVRGRGSRHSRDRAPSRGGRLEPQHHDHRGDQARQQHALGDRPHRRRGALEPRPERRRDQRRDQRRGARGGTPAPGIWRSTASRWSIRGVVNGQEAVLHWDASPDAALSINHGVGDVSGNTDFGVGSVSVALEGTRTFVLTATRMASRSPPAPRRAPSTGSPAAGR